MTVSSTTNAVSFLGNGATTAFPFTFRVDAAADIEVTLLTVATSAETAPLDPSVYSVTLDGVNGGTITYPLSGSPLASTHRINIRRVLDYTQTLDLTDQSAYFPTSLEAQLDRLTMMVQQIAEVNARTIQLPLGSTQDPEDYLAAILALSLSMPLPLGSGGTGQSVASIAALLSALGLGTEDTPDFTNVKFGGVEIFTSGAFTPTVMFGGSSVGITGTFEAFHNTFFNKLTVVNLNLTFTNKGAGAGDFTIGNLPGTISTSSGAIVKGLGNMSGLRHLPAFNPIAGGSTASLVQLNAGGTASEAVGYANFANNSTLFAQLLYTRT